MDEKRFKELYNRAASRGYKVFCEFLNMDEQSILKASLLPCTLFGGFENAERVVAGFGDDIEHDDFPITCLEVSALSQKFSDTLTHRDYLGALMNLGIKREMLGDILIKDKSAYIFCLDKISDFIADNLTRIKRTSVTVKTLDALPGEIAPEPACKEIIVSSCRLDALVSAVYKLSRNESQRLFNSDKIFVNSRAVQNTSRLAKENDIISVRGFGRFIFCGVVGKTKKDRLVTAVKIF